MKTTEKKSTPTSLPKGNQPFFQKEGEASFFSEIQPKAEPFFNPSAISPKFNPTVIQSKLTIGKPGDKYEQEADAMADHVVQRYRESPAVEEDTEEPADIQQKSENSDLSLKPEPHQNPSKAPLIQLQVEENQEEELQKKEEDIIQESPLEKQADLPIAPPSDGEDDDIQMQGDSGASDTAPASLESRLSSNSGGGNPLSTQTQSEMGSAFGADFSGVRIHTDSSAVQMNKELGAQAFTHGSDVYFNEGKYNPESSSGKHLLAHELTHTVQQGAAIQTKPQISSAPKKIQGFDLGLRDEIAERVDRYVPGYSMLSVAIGYDLIRGKSVERNRENIIKGVFSLINPWGTLLREKLEEHGIIQDAFNWINTTLEKLGLTRSAVSRTWDALWEEMSVSRGISGNLQLAKERFGPFVNKIISFASRVATKVFDMVKQAFLKLLAKAAKAMGGYDLLADLLGHDPITGEARNATTADILRGILKLPVIQAIGGDKLLAKLEELNLIEKAADWIDMQWALLKGAFSNLLNIASKFLELFSWETLKAPLKLLTEIKDEVFGFVGKVITFFKNLATEALRIIKEVMTYLLKTFVNDQMYGFDLVKVLLGKDPFTGEKYPRTPKNIIKAFIKLLPGGEEIYKRFEETGAIDRMLAWINNAVSEFIQILLGLKDAFVNLWKTSSIHDLFDPIGFFTKIVNLFKEPVVRLVAFVKMVVKKIIEVMMDIMQFPIEIGKKIIENAMKAFNDIKKDPVKFFLNLLGAVKKGFADFFSNIGSHLLSGVTGWLFGQLAKTGIKMPKDFSLGSILDLVFQVLGLTMDNLWARLAKKIGQKKVDKIRGAIDKLVGIWTFITDVVKNGLSAIWKYLKEKISGLWDMIINSAKDWIITKIIQKVTTKLLSMLDPTGIMAVVNGFMAFFNAVQSFIEKFKEMLQIVATFVKGLSEIAKGTISIGASFLENALSKALPVAISFLANQVGLGSIGEKIKELIKKVQGYVGQGIDWLIDKAKAAMGSIMGLFGGNKGEKSKNQDQNKHQKIADQVLDEMTRGEYENKTYEEIRSEKEKEAKKIEQKYQPKLKDNIKIKISFLNKNEDQKDQDLDVKVTIAPNATVKEKPIKLKSSKLKLDGVTRKSMGVRFTSDVKKEMTRRYKSEFKKKGAALGKYKDAELDIRHKISINDIIEHWKKVLEDSTLTEAIDILTKNNYPPKQKNTTGIINALKELFMDANNDTDNLFVGDMSVNRSLQEAYDSGDGPQSPLDPGFDADKAEMIGYYGAKGKEFRLTIKMTNMNGETEKIVEKWDIT